MSFYKDTSFQMTSDSLPIPFISSASNVLGGNYGSWRAFNSNLSDNWRTNNTAGWLQIKLDEPRIFTKANITITDSALTIKTFTIQGSDDGVKFITLGSFDDIVDWSNGSNSFDINSYKRAFLFYRLSVTATNGNGISINEWSFEELCPNKNVIIKNNNKYFKYNSGWEELILSGTPNYSNYLLANSIEEFNNIPTDAWEYFNGEVDVLIMSEKSKADYVVTTTTDNFSPYEYISNYPTLLNINEIDSDTLIGTNIDTNTYDAVIGVDIDVLLYSDNLEINNPTLEIESTINPINLLSNNVTVYSKVDNEEDLFVTGTQVDKLITFSTPLPASGIQSIIGIFNKLSDVSLIRLAFSNDNVNWRNYSNGSFNSMNINEIKTKGNTVLELNSFGDDVFLTDWNYQNINVGILLSNDVLGEYSSELLDVIIKETTASDSPIISNLACYILNTTASINIRLEGNRLIGQVSDLDMTRVQYKVTLNNSPYFPDNGNYTQLANPPQNIDLTITSSDIKINDWNTLRVEFRDTFGTVDYWEVTFIGRYYGLMYKTMDNQYYSSDIGEILQYLDFGQILTGQTSQPRQFKLVNENVFDVHDVRVSVNKNQLPPKVTVELSTDSITWSDGINIPNLSVDEEIVINIRLRSDITANSTGINSFDIYASGSK